MTLSSERMQTRAAARAEERIQHPVCHIESQAATLEARPHVRLNAEERKVWK